MLKYLLPLFAATGLLAQSPSFRSPGPVIISTQGGVNQTILTNGIDGNTAASIAATNVSQGYALGATNVYHGGTVEIVKYISQQRPAIADTNWYGPWTPGTTTAGIQEAWDSVWKGTNYGPYVPTVQFVFGAGYFFYTNLLRFTNTYPFGVTLSGQNLLATKLVYAGASNNISTIVFGSTVDSSPGRLNLPAHVTIKDLSFTAARETTNILVEVRDYSDLNIERVNFTSFQVLTNQADGAGVSLDSQSFSSVFHTSIVGLKIWRGPEHGTHLSSLYFMALAAGIDARNDHIFANDLRFAHIGVTTNLWATTDRYKLGACVLREGGLTDIWQYGHCYSSKAGFFLLSEAYSSPVLYNWNFEDCTTPLGSLRSNVRTPIVVNPTVHGDLTWDSGPVKVYCLTNSPNYGVLTSLLHTNGVVWGTDQFAAASADSAFEVRVGDERRFIADSLGTKTKGRHDVESGTTTTTTDANGISTTDGVNANQLNANGSASFATGAAEIDAAGALKATGSLTLYEGATAKFRIKFGADSLQFDDLVNTIDGFITYDFLTGILSYGEMNASKITSADGSAIDLIRPRMGTNSVSVTPNVSLYLTNFDGTVYRLSAQKL